MDTSGNLMELTEARIRAHYDGALALLRGFDHAPRIARPAAGGGDGGETGRAGVPGMRRGRFRPTTPGLVTADGARPDGVRLLDRIAGLDGDDPLISPAQAAVMRALRRGIAVSRAMVETYEQQTPLGAMKRDNLKGRLPAARRGEFAELLAAASLIGLFTFAGMTAWLLEAETAEGGTEAPPLEVEEILTDNPQIAMHGALWELDRLLAGGAGTDPAALVTAFCERLMEKVALRAGTARHLEPFLQSSYLVAADDFRISGFVPAHRARDTALSMSFKKPEEVIGNHIAKHQAMRLARMLMAYDFERRMNPFAELGGFVFTFMGDGRPGTGKTTLIQMMAGLLHDYCQVAGYPFRYRNLSTESIDSYQGRSAQNARAFIDDVMDPSVIGFGTIDDIDQLAGRRGDRNASAGQLEITAVLMQAFAGAGTVVRGNCTFGMFSNHPENVDDALRQRAGARFLVDGPQTREDYIDILALLLGDNHDIPLGEHRLFAAQELRRAVAESFASHDRPREEALLRVWERVTAELGPLDTLAKIGTYLKRIHEVDERFTGRAIKNITDAIKTRAMDFDLPDEWMERPELFLFQPYPRKLEMIRALMRPITVEMVLQEINRYADSEFRYAETADEAAIAAALREMERMEEARRRFMKRKDRA